MRVSNPPSKPTLLWDGDCHFCRRWVERWNETTRGAVDYIPFQEIGDRFPEISREEFERAATLVEPDGAVCFGAQAAFRALRSRPSRKWLSWSYEHVPGFAIVCESVYKLISRNRRFGSIVTRFFWGNDVRPPTYFWSRRWFLRAIGLVYLIAFVSLWTQIDGLVGSNGITPVREFLPAVHDQIGSDAWLMLPTLCWLNSSDVFLHFLCGAGVVLSLLLIFGIAPAICLAALFVFYLSLTIAGQTFLSFQWDILLLETGFLSIFLAPWRLWPRRGMETPVSRPALFLLKFLLFKLMLMSGVVKLTSGDDSWGCIDHAFHWSALTALDYHYWSQPLPTIFAWWADKSPEWFKHFSVAFCLFIEIVVPFFMWMPRRPRLIAAGLLIFLQIVIAITGNYCFFNLLTIALCLLLIDDGSLRRMPAKVIDRRYSDWISIYVAVAFLIVTLPINVWLITTAFKPGLHAPRLLGATFEQLEAFRIANPYGLFREMTKDRCEIVIEGRSDGIDWQPYEFKWKPGDVMRAPGWCAPHQPRLDWQMWFAALRSYRQNPWFVRLVICLLHGKPEVTRLFAQNPFPEAPPRYVRASFYRYRFASSEEHRETGAWWKRQELGEYLPSVSLEDVR
jgi:predicted DCC family thiol-disulfide oxidoreductase YuxK